MTLRHFVLTLPLLTMLGALPGTCQTGTPAIPAYDSFMSGLLSKYKIPGASLAIVKDGKLILARGYGMADPDKEIAAQPDSRYRIASLSKLVVAVTVMHLVEQGKLNLDQPAFALLPDLQSPSGKDADDRLASITIRNLLNHTGGWDDAKSGFDATWDAETVVSAMGGPSPPTAEAIIRYMRGQKLDNDPGLYYAYANLGYMCLARIIERVTNTSYEQYVRTNVLAPMGITDARIANTFLQGQLPKEVAYKATGNTPSVYPDVTPKSVPWPYGGWSLENQDAQGSWVFSTIDYARFVAAIEGRRGKAFLQASSIAEMTKRPGARTWDGTPSWYGFALMVRPTANGQNWWHNGAMDGTITYQVRTDSGFNWVVFLNYRPNTSELNDQLFNDIDSGLWNATAQVNSWPGVDYFSTLYLDADPIQSAAKPALTTREGVVNSATFGRGIVSGSWGTVYGVNLSKTTRSWTAADIVGDQLPTSLDGVSVKVNGQLAAISYISPNQINFQAPADLEAGYPAVEVLNNGVSTGVVLAHATRNAPGAFTMLREGVAYAVATKSDGSLLDGITTAAPGDVITVYCTGIAPSAAGTLISQPQRIGNPIVTIGAVPATVEYTGLIGPGLFQINLLVPKVAGGLQALRISPNNISSPAGVYLPIRAAN